MTPYFGAKSDGAELGHISAILPGADYLAPNIPVTMQGDSAPARLAPKKQASHTRPELASYMKKLD
jgi:hypothetical protein